MRGNGGIIGVPNIPTTDAASGIWGIREHYQAVKDGIWPRLPTLEFIGSYENIGDVSAYSFTTASIEPGLIVISVGFESNNNPLSSVTIGGETTTNVGSFGNNIGAYLSYLETTSATTSVVVNTVFSAFRCVIGVYRITNYTSATPVSSTNSSSSSTTINASVTPQSRGSCLISAMTAANQSTGTSWSTNVTLDNAAENYDTTTSENASTFSGYSGTSQDTSSVTFTSTYTGTASGIRIVAASWI